MRLILSFSSLFLSVALLQVSSGAVGPLDALSGLTLDFSRAQIGMLGSAHFTGFFIGCWWAPRLMGTVGHSRAFAVFTALGAIGLLAHMLVINPVAWAIMRVASGLCVAGCYTVIEAWMNARVENRTRGRVMGSYRMIDLGASLVAQLMIGVLEPAHYVSYNILAIACCAAILPLVLTRSSQPETPSAPRLRPGKAWRLSPLAVAGVVVAGLTSAAFRMVGPLYGQEVGLNPAQIAWFLAAFVAGGAAAQVPTGWLADKYDRRWVLIWLSIAAIGSCTLTVLVTNAGVNFVFLTAALFGFTAFPVFSVAAAHAHDFADNSERIELSAALMFWFAIGAIASPLATSWLIEGFGPKALFAFIATGHLVLVVFGLTRMRVRATVETRTPYVYAPRTSFAIGRLLARFRDPK
ncbi:MAG: MFS transporter [Rhodobacteraceae bacterium]|nr:MFS transporter [Paracoccaceae bacterium]